MTPSNETNGAGVRIRKMPRGEYTKEGAYYIQIDGHNIGFKGRTHWETKTQAQLVANAIQREVSHD